MPTVFSPKTEASLQPASGQSALWRWLLFQNCHRAWDVGNYSTNIASLKGKLPGVFNIRIHGHMRWIGNEHREWGRKGVKKEGEVKEEELEGRQGRKEMQGGVF